MLILLILYIICIISVIFIENKNPTEAMLWVFVMVCLPYFGLFLYLALGSTLGIKIAKRIRSHRLEQDYRKSPLSASLPPYIVEYRGQKLSSLDSEVSYFQKKYNNNTLTSIDSYEILTDGRVHYKKLFDDIDNAEKTIFIQFYTLHNDRVGQAFVEKLTKKLKEGVKVYILIDFVANIPTPNSLFKEFRANGGIIKRVKPYFNHFRSHRKIVIIDHKIGYIGGMNIGEQYAHFHKVKTPWRDTQIRFTGRCIYQLTKYYLEDFLCSLSRKELEALDSTSLLPSPCDNYKDLEPCQFVVGSVDSDKEQIKMAYLSMIRGAKKRIQIQSPYFVPDSSILDALKVAAASGVQIELMIPNVKAGFFLDPVTRYYSGEMLKLGVKVYKYKGYIHAKTLTVDDEICCIGSVNMDIRSLLVDDEIFGIFYGNDMVGTHHDIFSHDIKSCLSYTLSDFESRSLGQRFAERVYLIFAPLM